MRSFLLLLACLCGANSYAGVVLEGRLPEDLMPEMRELIDAAIAKSDLVEQRGFIEQEAKGRRIAARGAVLPSFATSVAFRQERDQDDPAAIGYEDRVIYNVTLTQPLYHWGALRSEKQIGDLQYELEKLNTQASLESLVNKVRRDYMELVVSKQRLARSRDELSVAEARLEFQNSQIEAGAASDASVLPYRLAVQREELGLLKELSDWEYKLGEFSIFVSMDAAQVEALLVEVIPEFEILERESLVGFGDYFEEGLNEDEDLQKLGLDIEIEKRRLLIADKALKPKVNAQVGLSSNALDVDGTRREQSYSYLGLSVGWNIFDGFRKKGRTIEVLNRLMRKERDKTLAEERTARNYERLVKRLEIESRVLEIEEQTLRAGRGRLKYITESYEEELVPLTELEKVQIEISGTLLKTQAARISYLLALSELATELGLDSKGSQ